MTQVIKNKRGNRASLPATANPGEILIALDTKEGFFGDGSGNTQPFQVDIANVKNLNKGAANGVASLDATTKVPVAQLPTNVANGVLQLDGSTKIPSSYLPAISIGERFPAASQAAMLALTAQVGDICLRSDLSNHVFLLTNTDASVLGNWVDLSAASSGITTVNGQTGPSVTLTTTNINEGTNLYYTDGRADARIAAAKGAASGVCELDYSSLVPAARIPTLDCGTY